MKAMILAAGEGTRLRPLTLETPKVLLPVGGKPLIEYTLAWLKKHGIREVAINLYHLGHKIKEHLGDGSRFGMRIVYSEEEKLLGTAGGAKRMAHLLSPNPQSPFPSPFVVVYGDVLTNFNLTAMLQFHREKSALATLALFRIPNPQSPVPSPQQIGVVEINEEGRILSFIEKPQSPVPNPRSRIAVLGSGGIYVLEGKVLDYIPEDCPCDFAYDIFPRLIEAGEPVYGYILSPGDVLIDIGTMDKYHKAQEIVHQFKVQSATLNLEHRT